MTAGSPLPPREVARPFGVRVSETALSGPWAAEDGIAGSGDGGNVHEVTTGDTDEAREDLVDLLGCDPGEIPFTEAQAASVAGVLDDIRARRARRRTPCATDEAA